MTTKIIECQGETATLDVVSVHTWKEGRRVVETLTRGPGRSFLLQDIAGTWYHDGQREGLAGLPAKLVGEVWA